VNKATLLARFLRDRAWWRLDSAGASAPRVAGPRELLTELVLAARANPGTPAISIPLQAPALETAPPPVPARR
jgi:hypothetical protein